MPSHPNKFRCLGMVKSYAGPGTVGEFDPAGLQLRLNFGKSRGTGHTLALLKSHDSFRCNAYNSGEFFLAETKQAPRRYYMASRKLHFST